jgi:hypothetical protein
MIMSPKIIINRLEIGFWNTVIPLMQHSSPVQMVMSWTYTLATRLPSTKVILIGLMSILAGGSLGFLLGVLNQFR